MRWELIAGLLGFIGASISLLREQMLRKRVRKLEGIVMPTVETTRLVMLMQYVEKHQSPPERGVTQGQLVHAGYTREEIQQAEDQGYIERMQGTSRIEYVVSGYSHGSL